MWLEFIGDTLDVFGKVLIALTAIAVHDTVIKEHRIDAVVGRTVRKEHVFGFLGITFIILGYTLKQLGKYAK
jgi:hypothetical protein